MRLWPVQHQESTGVQTLGDAEQVDTWQGWHRESYWPSPDGRSKTQLISHRTLSVTPPGVTATADQFRSPYLQHIYTVLSYSSYLMFTYTNNKRLLKKIIYNQKHTSMYLVRPQKWQHWEQIHYHVAPQVVQSEVSPPVPPRHNNKTNNLKWLP